MGNPRIDELRRRVQTDPASIAFAQLAEEYRRAGQFEDAVAVCRTGLTRHPGYLSARVTLGRALLELGELDEAGMELQFVVNSAPENLAAIRGLAEIYQRQGQLTTALEYYRRALALASHDPELEDVVQHISRELGRHQDAHAPAGLSFEEAHDALVEAATRVPQKDGTGDQSDADPGDADAASPAAAFDFDTLLAAMGTPAAPAPVDALLDGTLPPDGSAPTVSLPEPVDDIPGDPFAALEADLRHYVPAPIAAGDEEVAPAPDATPNILPGEETPSAFTVEGAAAEGPAITDTVVPPTDEPHAVFDPASFMAEEPGGGGAVHDITEPGTVETRPEVYATSAVGDSAPETAVPAFGTGAAAPSSVPAAAEGDPVLDELERWLAVLQDRASTSS